MPDSDPGEKVEETNAGVKKKGNWKDISRFGEAVEDAKGRI